MSPTKMDHATAAGVMPMDGIEGPADGFLRYEDLKGFMVEEGR